MGDDADFTRSGISTSSLDWVSVCQMRATRAINDAGRVYEETDGAGRASNEVGRASVWEGL